MSRLSLDLKLYKSHCFVYLMEKMSIIKPLLAVGIIAFLAILIMKAQIIAGMLGVERAQCPYTSLGNPDASVRLQYFDSPFCPACWVQEPYLQELVEERGDDFVLEKYDINMCKRSKELGVRGTPAFYIDRGEPRLLYGVLAKEQLVSLLFE